ncbi:YybH family protein [Herbiconiux daphne]|uniref:Nuclear transport factor 2 family protein n=1 Tax=Herbiconiux daphne TaxID=2970914 RepID=A0ABT2H3C5_9MICO|nr:nuclear transport factor 2 family protein [Herbiconiux daphne]MCS5734430.1 nuclear transport factor 2 family protein [Herbiconiux daphne]
MSGASGADTEVLDGILDMYDAFMARDRARFDSHLDADVTTWESPLPRIMTRSELDRYRDERPPAVVAAVLELRVEPERIDVWGDHALARYLFVAVRTGGSVETSRVTDVLRRGADGRWLIVHHHSELWAADVPAQTEAEAEAEAEAVVAVAPATGAAPAAAEARA